MSSAFPYYLRGLRAPARAAARIRIGADGPGTSYSIAKARGMSEVQNTDAQFVGFYVAREPTNPSVYDESMTIADDASGLDDWYGAIVDNPFVDYAVAYVRDPITHQLSMVNEFTRDTGGGSASATVTGPSSGTITITDPTPKSKPSGGSGMGWVLGGFAGILAIGLIVSGGKKHEL